jgi:Zn2+/Cd2+-exporting ATPase
MLKKDSQCSDNQGCPACDTCNDNRPWDASGKQWNTIRPLVALSLFGVALLFRGTLRETPWSSGFYIAFLIPYLLAGYKVIATAFRNILRGKVFDENFLMTIATFGALALGEIAEAAAVMLFYTIGEWFQERAVFSARRSIKALTDIRPDSALLLPEKPAENEQPVIARPEDVPAGSRILVRTGERIPLDGTILSGSSWLDNSILTGESKPVRVSAGDAVMAGGVNGSGILTIQTSASYGESSLARIIRLVEEASSRKASTERFITKFARYYTPAVVAAALMIAFLPPLFLAGASFAEWIRRALILLVVSCPCALVVSIPLTYFGGIGGASRSGILIKGANFLEALAQLHTVVLDKTGTLTHGVFEVKKITAAPPWQKKDIISLAAWAETWSNHPIAAAIRRAAEEHPHSNSLANRKDADHFLEIAGKGIKTVHKGSALLTGSRKLLEEQGVTVARRNGSADTTIFVAYNREHIGTITIADRIKPSSLTIVEDLRKAGVQEVMMLTGDGREGAAAVATSLGIKNYCAGLLPEDKLAQLESVLAYIPKGKTCAFAGDGINDAPVLSRADIGIAMGSIGSDAAIEAADIVIMDDQPSSIALAVSGAKGTRSIVIQNIILALGVKAAVMILGVMGAASMAMAIFADVGVALLAILNATRALRLFRRSTEVQGETQG